MRGAMLSAHILLTEKIGKKKKIVTPLVKSALLQKNRYSHNLHEFIQNPICVRK